MMLPSTEEPKPSAPPPDVSALYVASWLAAWHLGAGCGLPLAERNAVAGTVARDMAAPHLLSTTRRASSAVERYHLQAARRHPRPRVRKLWQREPTANRSVRGVPLCTGPSPVHAGTHRLCARLAAVVVETDDEAAGGDRVEQSPQRGVL